VAAVHASVLTTRATKAHERKLLASTRECTLQIEKLLGNTHGQPNATAKVANSDKSIRRRAA
jgi:hypothetical protein